MSDDGDLGERLGGARDLKVAALIRNVAYPNPGGFDDAGLRNAFATARGVALFGPRGQWSDYRRTYASANVDSSIRYYHASHGSMVEGGAVRFGMER